MNKTAWILIIAGACVMAVSIYRFRKVFHFLDEFRIKDYEKSRRIFNLHITLMVIFLIGYIAVLYGSMAKKEVFGDIFVGVIFFFGAIFVLLGVILQSKMLSGARVSYLKETEARTSLEIERSKLMSANANLLIEMENTRKAEEALKESENHLRTVFNSVQAGIVIIDPIDHTIVDINDVALRLVGFKREDVLGCECHKLICPAEKDKCPVTDLKLHLDNTERALLTSDGRHIPILKTATPITLKGRDLLLENFIDITKLKKAEEERVTLEAQLRRARQMESIGTLAGGVAHDLNNILSGIVSYPDLLLAQLPEDSTLRKPIATIQESGEKAAAIVNDLLTLARRGVAKKEVVDLNRIILDYLESPEFLKLKSYHPDVRIITRLKQDIMNISGSPHHIFKMLMNLVSNGAEAMLTGGTLTIETDSLYLDKPVGEYVTIQEGDYTVLTITDTGVGMAKDEMERIFDPFYTKKVMGKSGTGLGMTVVWGTIKDHSGYIDIKSSPGNGTSFTIYLPITREKVKGTEEKHKRSLDEYKGNGESILVVDDIRQQREITSEMLSALKYSVKSVSSGEEAIENLRDNPADLVLLDMIMKPGMDGLETYKKILEINPNQKAVITSGFSDIDHIKKAQELGASEYLKKPYTLEKLGITVKKALYSE